MTKIKLCGLSRAEDIISANSLLPDYIGFVFCKNSKRYINAEKASELKSLLDKRISVVGVFCDEPYENINYLINEKIIDIAQLHGNEDNTYIGKINAPTIKAFNIKNTACISNAKKSAASYIMLDSGGGTGKSFNHELIENINRDYFLAGGLTDKNVGDIIKKYKPYAVDASSSLETNGAKDADKMAAFVCAARNGGKYND